MRSCATTTNLVPQFSIHIPVSIWTKLLLKEREQHRDDDTRLEGLSENNKEDGDGENLDHLDSYEELIETISASFLALFEWIYPASSARAVEGSSMQSDQIRYYKTGREVGSWPWSP